MYINNFVNIKIIKFFYFLFDLNCARHLLTRDNFNIPSLFYDSFRTVCSLHKYNKDPINKSLHLARNKLGYLSPDIICSEKRTVFRERSGLRSFSESFEKQMMSKDKYLSLFSRQMEAIVFIILQIFFATRVVFKIGEYITIIP